MLKERIGAGGYGEVWSAEAPGGIAKAVKLVYGYHDENRAQGELKALNRVRELRHPFLLSLERIEVVDGQLIVVTELADKSLKDHYDECVDDGQAGIPRDELLKYIGEAAEALDYISNEHQLQHLDVKPENLLMVSGHIKVADFGLVKELQDTNQSLMTGLTPIYAPPELFDGRPSRTSDQYSLAIVYQEMLTGTRPFSGSTAAQLASQHMNARPRLSSLPRGDQAVILRALSKDQDLRFENCAEMVAALTKRKANQARKRKPTTRVTSSNTSVLGDSTLERYITAAEVKQLEPIAVERSEASVVPTLFIGVGQTGTNVIKSLRQKLREQIGLDDDYPAFSFLCLDTDERDLMASCTTSGGPLKVSDTLPIPLRKPEEYRDQGSLHHSWLSRRWIYNVPRSLRTEGIRPLGRLAFADHHEKIFQQLHERLEEITKPELLAQTAETLALDPVGSRARAFVIGSIAGGVGSGMILDLAYAVRTVLLEQGIPDEDVIGILMHSTGRSATERDLTVANTCAFLSEMNHFSSMAGYPGDETCNLPPFEEDSEPFSSSYVVHLGDDLNQREYDNSIDEISEYLYLNAASPCGSYFDECRRDNSATNRLRTFSVRTATFSDGHTGVSGTDLSRLALQSWTAEYEPDHKYPKRSETAQTLLTEQQLTISGLTSRANVMIESRLQTRPDEYLANIVREAMQQTQNCETETPGQNLMQNVSQLIAHVFQCFPYDESENLCSNSPTWAADAIRVFAKKSCQPLLEALEQHMNEPGVRFAGANTLRYCLVEQLRITAAELHDARQKNLQKLMAAEKVLCGGQEEPILDARGLANVVSEYAQRRLAEMILFASEQLALTTINLLDEKGRDMESYSNSLASCLKQFEDAVPISDVSVMDPEHIEELLTQIDRQLDAQLYIQYDGLLPFLEVMNESRRNEMLNMLHNAACRASRHIRRTADLETALSKSGIVGEAAADWIEKHMGGAAPALSSCGGASRLLLAVPDRSQPNQIGEWVQDRLGEPPTIVPATSGNLVLCHEIENVPLGNMVYQFFCQHPESIEYVSRIHTRVDVDWSPLSPNAT
jgi:serine/threonine protein kinase